LISFFEIYNEKVYDLLDMREKSSVKKEKKERIGRQKEKKESLQIRDNPDGTTTIPHLIEVEVNSLAQAYAFLQIGLRVL
jgi:hypothetical protein